MEKNQKYLLPELEVITLNTIKVLCDSNYFDGKNQDMNETEYKWD